MKHRLLLLLLFVFTTSVAGWAQKSVAPSYTIKGVLLDSLTQEGEPYAPIRITKKCFIIRKLPAFLLILPRELADI